MPQGLSVAPQEPLSILALLISLLLGAAISLVLAWHFRRFGRTMSNRAALARVFPLIVLTTVLVISVVKSSLALSLGLVGALSIVRFRTPIKEPEELAYLFMAIAVGLGLGADQIVPTVAASVVILGLLAVRALLTRPRREHNLFLNIDMMDGDKPNALKELTEVLRRSVRMADFRRLDLQDGRVQATFSIDCEDDQKLLQVMSTLKESFPGASITFVDQGVSTAA
jgi:uncharacterized membrane protein YhiD involved in acid resistance